jgi:hypothetical protein
MIPEYARNDPAAGEIESTQAGRTNSLDGKPDSGACAGTRRGAGEAAPDGASQLVEDT